MFSSVSVNTTKRITCDVGKQTPFAIIQQQVVTGICCADCFLRLAQCTCEAVAGGCVWADACQTMNLDGHTSFKKAVIAVAALNAFQLQAVLHGLWEVRRISVGVSALCHLRL